MKKVKLLSFIILFSFPFFLKAQQLVYKPINPAFGGNNTYNYNWLLSSAEAQNKFKEETDVGYEEKTELEQFTETLNRQLLNSLSQDLFQQEFGDDALTVGTYVFGSLVVDITPTTGGLSINVLDTETGDQTQIIIPNN
ncbi:curli production assembly/transport component CsgF [Lutibacter sp. B1]|uniref:curli production assembly/transport component CsgF n=1 Tax=Lutibacter sp. B1 TaxID=2725996 RepID=UPI0014564E87|nr:curli production assembly/transport component CsgF [Lutibacter sp. B1]NLP58079.1 curli assembly protein CsgF [Lutibacter sp. B1]